MMAVPALPAPELVAVSLDAPAPETTSTGGFVVHKRDRLTVSIHLGATRIERAATALQDARDGQRLFVKTGDGDVLSVRAAKAP